MSRKAGSKNKSREEKKLEDIWHELKEQKTIIKAMLAVLKKMKGKEKTQRTYKI